MSYTGLKKLRDEIGQIHEISSIMHWDASVITPKNSAPARGRAMGYLANLAHQKSTSKEYKAALDSAKSEKSSLSEWDRKNLELIEKEYNLSTCLPEDLVIKTSEATSECEMVWREARAQNNFELVRPNLEKVFDLTKEKANRFGEVLGKNSYDALLDQYDSGQTQSSIDKIFSVIEKKIPELLTKIQAKQKAKPKLNLTFPKSSQEKILKDFIPKLQFDFNSGRLDESTHPFCGGIPEDIRITTRYYEHDFTASFLGVVHEAGHAMYERNLPREYARQPVGSACSFSIHESQSLFIEKQVCKNRNFLEFFYNQYFTREFDQSKQYSFQDLYNFINHVEPSFIRVDADEVTYPLHILIRYKIEKALFSGELKIKDLSEYFDELYVKYLGIKPTKSSEGCLQDIHWYFGAFGYFPSYTLGAMSAAQIMNKLRSINPNIDQSLKTADLASINLWLKDNIHKYGSLYTSNNLLRLATGEELNPDYFINYLSAKYI